METEQLSGKEIDWQIQLMKLNPIYRDGIQQFLESFENPEKVFELKDRFLRCMDEGTPGGLHLAGTGILLADLANLSVEDLVAAPGWPKLKRFIESAHIGGFTYHKDCGAVKLYEDEKGLPLETDEDAQKFAELLAQAYREESGQDIPVIETPLIRAEGLHQAVAIYYDGTGSFDPSQNDNLPAGFVISRKYLDSEYAKKELEIALRIATGGHGFDLKDSDREGKFSEETPLLIVGVSSADGVDTETLLTEIEAIIPEELKQSIRIDSLVKPAKLKLNISPLTNNQPIDESEQRMLKAS